QPFDLSPGLAQMRLKGALQLSIRRLLDHVRQRFLDLLLGVIDVLQRMNEQVLHRLDVIGKPAHNHGLLALLQLKSTRSGPLYWFPARPCAAPVLVGAPFRRARPRTARTASWRCRHGWQP